MTPNEAMEELRELRTAIYVKDSEGKLKRVLEEVNDQQAAILKTLGYVSRTAKSPPSDLKRPGRDCPPVHPPVSIPGGRGQDPATGTCSSPPAVEPSPNCPAPEGLSGASQIWNGVAVFLPLSCQNQVIVLFYGGVGRLP